MKENQQLQNSNDEIDLGQLFKLIGQTFDRFIGFITSILKSIFSLLIYSIKPIIVNFKIILLVVGLAGIIGYVLDRYKPIQYTSQMLVKPYFDSKYQLVNTINYYNALLSSNDYEALANIFNIDKVDIKEIVSFEITPGPETENERILQYNTFLKSIDSTGSIDVSFDDFVENRSIYSGDLFEINVTSYKNDIFSKLEDGLGNSFTNKYSEKKMKKRDSLISIQKENIKLQLLEVESLQEVYIKVLEEESKSPSTELNLGGEGLTLNKDKTQTKEFELLNKEIQLRNELKLLDEKKVEEDVFYDVIASFQEVGNKKSIWYEKYALTFPVLSFIFLCLIYLIVRVVNFVKNYEA